MFFLSTNQLSWSSATDPRSFIWLIFTYENIRQRMYKISNDQNSPRIMNYIYMIYEYIYMIYK